MINRIAAIIVLAVLNSQSDHISTDMVYPAYGLKLREGTAVVACDSLESPPPLAEGWKELTPEEKRTKDYKYYKPMPNTDPETWPTSTERPLAVSGNMTMYYDEAEKTILYKNADDPSNILRFNQFDISKLPRKFRLRHMLTNRQRGVIFTDFRIHFLIYGSALVICWIAIAVVFMLSGQSRGDAVETTQVRESEP